MQICDELKKQVSICKAENATTEFASGKIND